MTNFPWRRALIATERADPPGAGAPEDHALKEGAFHG
jgi:hypothetical protein